MPTIESRKYPGKIQYVPPETWKEMQEKSIARRFKVIDNSDLEQAVEQSKTIKFREVINSFSEENVDNSAGIVKPPEMEREDIKNWLDEHEIPYNKYWPTPKLHGLYIKNQ